MGLRDLVISPCCWPVDLGAAKPNEQEKCSKIFTEDAEMGHPLA